MLTIKRISYYLLSCGCCLWLASCGGSSSEDPDYQANNYPINDAEKYTTFHYQFIDNQPEKIKYRRFPFPRLAYNYQAKSNATAVIMGEFNAGQIVDWQPIKNFILPFSDRIDLYGDPKIQGEITLDQMIEIPYNNTKPRLQALLNQRIIRQTGGNLCIADRNNPKLFKYVVMGRFAKTGLLGSVNTEARAANFLIGKNPTPTDNSEYAMPTSGIVQYDVYSKDMQKSGTNNDINDGADGLMPYPAPFTLTVDFKEKKITGNVGKLAGFETDSDLGNIMAEIKGNKFFSFIPNTSFVEGGFYGPNGVELMAAAINVSTEHQHAGHQHTKHQHYGNSHTYMFVGRKAD